MPLCPRIYAKNSVFPLTTIFVICLISGQTIQIYGADRLVTGSMIFFQCCNTAVKIICEIIEGSYHKMRI